MRRVCTALGHTVKRAARSEWTNCQGNQVQQRYSEDLDESTKTSLQAKRLPKPASESDSSETPLNQP